MKILHIIYGLFAGGAERLLTDILPIMQDRGYEVDLLVLNLQNTYFKCLLDNAGVEIFKGAGPNPYGIRQLFAIRKIVDQYDIIHTHTSPAQLWGAIACMGKNKLLITTEHSTDNRKRRSKIYSVIDKLIFKLYSKVICISNKTEENLRKYLNDYTDKIVLINNGVNISGFASASSKSLLSLPKNEENPIIKLVQTAGFRDAKDQDTVIKALTILPDEYHIFLIGDGPRRGELEKLCSELKVGDRVHFLGVRSDVPNLLKDADIGIISSHWEGFGLAAVEYMASGIPVVASGVPGVKEVVEGAGLIFNQGDFRDLAEKILSIEKCSEAEKKQLKEKLLVRANEYSIDKMVDKYLEVYENLYGSWHINRGV